MNLNVGDVVFVIDKKTQSVVPCQLVERISTITLEGEEIKHIACTPGGKRFDLTEYSSAWFETYEKTEEYLTSAALDLVSITMKRAEEAASKSFGYERTNGINPPLPDNSPDLETEIGAEKSASESDQVFVEMGGQKVRVTLPKELVND